MQQLLSNETHHMVDDLTIEEILRALIPVSPMVVQTVVEIEEVMS